MSNRERIETEVGISVPKTNRVERFTIRIFLKIIELYAGNLSEVREAAQTMRTVVDIAEDFEKGRIPGKVVPGTGQPLYTSPESHKIFIVRMNSKTYKRREFRRN
jgi:hypothetical protein